MSTDSKRTRQDNESNKSHFEKIPVTDLKHIDWVKSTVWYQIFPDSFARKETKNPLSKELNLLDWGAEATSTGFYGGNIPGVSASIPYLENLGINGVYFTPIFQSASNHRYHTHDYFRVDPILGDNQSFEYFLEKAKKRNIRVLLDGVFNHSSRGFFQFNHLLEVGKNSPYVDWWITQDKYPLTAYSQSEKPNYSCWYNIPALPQFNHNHVPVQEFIKKVALYWLSKDGVSGWRLDAPDQVKVEGFWASFRNYCKQLKPDSYIIGEIWTNALQYLQDSPINNTTTPPTTSKQTKRNEKEEREEDEEKEDFFDKELVKLPECKMSTSTRSFDGVTNYQFSNISMEFFLGKVINETVTFPVYREIKKFKEIENPALHFSNRISEFLSIYPLETQLIQFTVLTSHDTPRLMTIAQDNIEAVKQVVFFQFIFPGVPCIYYGEELGLKGGRDPECRRTFPWPTNPNTPPTIFPLPLSSKNITTPATSTTDSSTSYEEDGDIDITSNETKPKEKCQSYFEEKNFSSFLKNEMFVYYQKLIELRKRLPELKDGNLKTLYAENDIYVCSRSLSLENRSIEIEHTSKKRKTTTSSSSLPAIFIFKLIGDVDQPSSDSQTMVEFSLESTGIGNNDNEEITFYEIWNKNENNNNENVYKCDKNGKIKVDILCAQIKVLYPHNILID